MMKLNLTFSSSIQFIAVFAIVVAVLAVDSLGAKTKPNIILVMTDDQGWGEMGYYDHPVLKTPHLDEMAANGLRFDRFYAGAPNCSPTRASVLTGRSNDRAGVKNHGYALRLQEKTLPQALQKAGYVTGHFGKWHLNAISGQGVPILKEDSHSPGAFGFDEWLSVTNYFDRDPILGREGKLEAFEGDSSEIVVEEALEFIGRRSKGDQPIFTVIWFGTPHSPFVASDEDKEAFRELDEKSQNHYGELVAMDRSIGALRKGLRDLGIEENTLVWFNSDNGGLDNIEPSTVGPLRGHKKSLYEGGVRVPCIVEWPAEITKPRVTEYPAVTMDIFPTLADIVGLPDSALLQPSDGISIRALFKKEIGSRSQAIYFRHTGRGAVIDKGYKLISGDLEKDDYELYDLSNDESERVNLFKSRPEIAKRLVKKLKVWNGGVEASVAGKDYPEGVVLDNNPDNGRRWPELEAYKPYLEQLKTRPEYSGEFKRTSK